LPNVIGPLAYHEYLGEEYLAWCIKNQNYKERSDGNQVLPRKS